MSSTVDNRVVEMQFNNSQFESNVKTSMNTIDKLKQSLNFSGVADSFDSITSSANKVDMSGLGGAVETVKEKFSALEVMAVTALMKITNAAIDAGVELVKSLSVDQISAGWEKFTENTQNIGTLISQGFDMSEVEDQMERLLWYTDETSYNYTDMVSNIAKFTAAGQGLTDSVTAMEGIANWAALSGQNATTASRAMYQLAQAMSAGTMRLQDYRSIQNANMDTQEFRQTCIDAAIAVGTLNDNLDGTYTAIENGGTFDINSFTEELTNGAWLTSEVMMDVFESYAGAVDDIYEYSEEKGITASEAIAEMGDEVDEFGLKAFKAAQEARSWSDVLDSVKDAVSTGWMNTFTYIFGNYEEATELWTDLSNAMYDVFMTGINDRNDVLEAWSELDGRTVLVEAFWNAWDNVGEICSTVKQAFKEVFPSATAEQLYSMTESLRDFSERLKMSDEGLANLKSTFKGLFSVLDIVKQAFTAIVKGAGQLLSGVTSLAGGILGVTGSFGDWLTSIDEAIKESDIFNLTVQSIVTIIQNAASEIGKFIKVIKEKFATPGFEALKSILSSVKDSIVEVIDSVFGMKESVSDTFDEMGDKVSNSGFVKVIDALWKGIKSIASAIEKVLSSAIGGLSSALMNFDLSNFFSVLNDLITSGYLITVTELIHNFSDGIKSASGFIENLGGGVTKILDEFGNVLQSWSNNIQAGTILKIAAAVGVLAVALIALSSIDSEQMGSSIAAITGLMVDLIAAMTAFQKFSGSFGTDLKSSVQNFIGAFTQDKEASSMIKMAAAIGILAVALAALANIDNGNLGSAFAAITGLFVDLTAAMVVLNKTGGKASGFTTIIGMAAAIDVLVLACKGLAELEPDRLLNTVLAVVTLTEMMVIAFKQLSSNEKVFITGKSSLITFSAAIEILALACLTLSTMDVDQLVVSMAGVATLTATMVVAFKTLENKESMFVAGGASMIAFSAAIEILALVAKTLATMELEQLVSSVAAIAALTATMVVAFKTLSSNYDIFVVGGSSMIAFSAAIEVLALACKTLATMDLPELAESVAALGVIVAEMVVALKSLAGIGNESSRLASASASMILLSSAILILTPALKALGNMSLGQIAKALITLAGAFTVVGAAATVLSPMTTTILELSAAFALIGVSVAAVGAGFVAAGAGLASIAVSIASLAAAVAGGSSAIVSGIEQIIVSIISFIPDVVVAIGEGIIGICDVIAGSAESIGNAAKSIILTLIDVFVECVPELANGAAEMVVGLLDSLTEYVPEIVTGLTQMVIGIIDSLADNIPQFLEAAMNLVGTLFSEIINALNGLDSGALVEGIACVGLLSALVVALSAVAGMVPAAMAGLAEIGALVAEMSLIFAAIGALSKIPGLTWLVNEGAGLLESIGVAIGSFVGGIVGGFMGGVSSQFPKIGADLSDFMTNVQPFIEGASDINASTLNGVKALAEAILVLTASDILSGLTSWFTGGSSLADFGQELADFGPYFKEYADSVDGIDADVVEASANAALALAEMAKKLPNSGGLSDLITGGKCTLSEFAQELSDFGPKLKDYADSVDGLDAGVVEESANAALALAEMAENLPNQGGVLGWFTGDNTLSVFAEELSVFGPILAEYANSVDGIDAAVVEASANAALTLTEMAENLPNQGGITSWFIGDNTLSIFGEELAKFGPYLHSYADSVDGIDAGVVEASANAALTLAEFADKLPNSGGLASIFTGDNGIGSFGKQLVSFGESFAKYYASVEGIATDKLSKVTDEFSRLVDVATGMEKINTSAMSGFASSLTDLGKAGIDGFISAFEGSYDRVTSVMDSIIDHVVSGISSGISKCQTEATKLVNAIEDTFKNKYSEFYTIGRTLISKLTDGVTSMKSNLKTSCSNLVTAAADAFKNKYSDFKTIGKDLIGKLIDGMESKESSLTKACKSLVSSGASAIKEKQSSFYDAGAYLVKGFVNGINDNISSAANKAAAMAKAASDAANAALNINSPSKVSYKTGSYFGQGFINAISDYVSKAYKAGTGIANSAKEGLEEAAAKISGLLDLEIDTEPTITPVLDLSEIEAGVATLDALLSRTEASSVGSSINASRVAEKNQNDESKVNENTYNYTQNNYSPKALNRIEIYRQTKNQFTALKEGLA